MDANMLLSWHKYGGGKELLNKLYASIGLNVVSVPVRADADAAARLVQEADHQGRRLQGLKFRTVGISIDVFSGMGAAVNALPGAKIVPAMDRGLLDAAEFNNATSDRISASPTSRRCACCRAFTRTPSSSRSRSTRTKYDALPDKMKAIIANAYRSRFGRHDVEGDRPLFEGLHRAADQGQGRFYKTPDSVLRKQLEIFDTVMAKRLADNALFKEIIDRRSVFAERAVKWDWTPT
jgi:TRAP-type mannitol/chloroaromatic compound transport system substrate-binding protein